METPENTSIEYFVEGTAIGLTPGPVPCILKSIEADSCSILVVDGQDTGVPYSVPASSVKAFDEEAMRGMAAKMFGGEEDGRVD
jgi:hypothetical protein